MRQPAAPRPDGTKSRNLGTVQPLCGRAKIETTVRYLGVEVDDALRLTEQIQLSASGATPEVGFALEAASNSAVVWGCAGRSPIRLVPAGFLGGPWEAGACLHAPAAAEGYDKGATAGEADRVVDRHIEPGADFEEVGWCGGSGDGAIVPSLPVGRLEKKTESAGGRAPSVQWLSTGG